MADDGPVPEALYFGVRGSVVCAGLMYSKGGILGTVWLRGLWKLALPDTTSPNIPPLGSGEKGNCEVEDGLKLPENVELGGSVMTLLREVVLCECGCLYPLLAKPMPNPEEWSFSSALPLVAEDTKGDPWGTGEAGEIPLGVCEVDIVGDSVSSLSRRVLSGIAVSDALRISLPGPIPCFCLNFSIHAVVIVFRGMSEPVQKTLAFSSIS
jgi:hypothetical protein